MALLMIIQLMPFTSLAEDDPDGVETSEILETITEDDFENEIEDEPEEEDPEEDEGLPDETEEDEDLEDDGAEADDSETDETDGEDDIPASFEIEDLSDPEVWEALFDNPDVEIIMDAEIHEAEDPVPVEEYTMEDMIQDNYDGSWIKYGIYNNKHTYVLTEEPTGVFSDPALTDESLVYTISEDNAILLATEHYEMWNTTGVYAWFLTANCEVCSGYVDAHALVNAYYSDEEAEEWTKDTDYCWLEIDENLYIAFVVPGYAPVVATVAKSVLST